MRLPQTQQVYGLCRNPTSFKVMKKFFFSEENIYHKFVVTETAMLLENL